MKNNSAAALLFVFGVVPVIFAADSPAPAEDSPIVLSSYTVTDKSLAESGFAFVAKSKKGVKAAKAGEIEEIVLTKVDRRSPAGKAGLKVGEKIVRIGGVKVDQLTFARLREEFARKPASGKILLGIRAADSDEVRTVELQMRPLAAEAPTPKEPVRKPGS